MRSIPNPRRLAYPCQQAALVNSLRFTSCLLPLFLRPASFYDRLRRDFTLTKVFFVAVVSLMVIGIRSDGIAVTVRASLELPEWTSPDATSDVFAVQDIPPTKCSLDGGTLSQTPPCNDPKYAMPNDGVDAIIELMSSQGTYFYQTAFHPDGIVAASDVVVIKVNNQWGGKGSGGGAGRLATNTDVLKGLIWRIVQHPQGFSGEVIVAENAQPTSDNKWDVRPANAEDAGQSFRDVVDAFQSLGYPVSLYDWTGLNGKRIHGGSMEDKGYPAGEYIHGDTADTYILLEDPAGTAVDELSYPKFRTANGHYVSMRYGIWNGGSYDSDRLTFINVPVLKSHSGAGATIAWKNLIGFVTADGHIPNRYGGYREMHDFFFGLTGGPNKEYGLIGRQIALIRAPDLNLVDAIWVPYESNYCGDAIRQDALLASTDPFAVDWYASEYVLFPLTGKQASSAARSGRFRNTTRTNQDSAELVWPGGGESFPYIDLLDAYDDNTPADAEKKQLNIYVTRPSIPPGSSLSGSTKTATRLERGECEEQLP
jgi:hypothetical protein